MQIDINKVDCRKIIDTYGIEKQSMQACEEAGEYIQAISKCVRSQGDFGEVWQLREEIADNLIMIAQLMEHYGITEANVEQMIAVKMERQKRRLEGYEDEF